MMVYSSLKTLVHSYFHKHKMSTIDVVIDSITAKQYWQSREFSNYYLEHHIQAEIITDVIKDILPKSIFEFGANAGRNLHFLRKNFKGIQVFGIDLNETAVQIGRKHFGFTDQELIVSDEIFLNRIKDKAFEVSFTVSVIDHIPEPIEIINNLIRVTSKRLLLLEPYIKGKSGAISGGKVVPYSYIHDYLSLLKRLGCQKVTIAPHPLGKKGCGPYYHLIEVDLCTE